jgi:hypothetical protein
MAMQARSYPKQTFERNGKTYFAAVKPNSVHFVSHINYTSQRAANKNAINVLFTGIGRG